MNAIIEYVKAGITIDENYINSELARRQVGYGRGGRMLIEKDTVKILSGVRHSKSTGAPICLQVQNKDWENWVIPMNPCSVEQTPENLEIIESKKIVNVRPGHADYAGAIKYEHNDIRDILERSSARETTMRVAVGAIAKSILFVTANSTCFSISFASIFTHSASLAIPPFPGKAYILFTFAFSFIFLMMACSLPPLPITIMFIINLQILFKNNF